MSSQLENRPGMIVREGGSTSFSLTGSNQIDQAILNSIVEPFAFQVEANRIEDDPEFLAKIKGMVKNGENPLDELTGI